MDVCAVLRLTVRIMIPQTFMVHKKKHSSVAKGENNNKCFSKKYLPILTERNLSGKFYNKKSVLFKDVSFNFLLKSFHRKPFFYYLFLKTEKQNFI